MTKANLTASALQLKSWIEEKHFNRKIKISGEPYFLHLTAVAEMAAPAVPFGYEIGLCHDLLEDTQITGAELQSKLISFTYSEADANVIASTVIELTDVFTAKAYPGLRKRDRKAIESDRLLTISSDAQTIKYCDLIYNIGWMLRYKKKKAKKYLKKKKLLLLLLNKGNEKLYNMANSAVIDGLAGLQGNNN